VLVIITDIFGAFTGRHQSIADTYAKWGYNVYLPEILTEVFKDDPTDMAKIVPYAQGLDQAKMRATFAALVAHLESQGYKRYLAIGFCWGVWKAFRLAT
jgi:dienelactone hydrolase